MLNPLLFLEFYVHTFNCTSCPIHGLFIFLAEIGKAATVSFSERVDYFPIGFRAFSIVSAPAQIVPSIFPTSPESKSYGDRTKEAMDYRSPRKIGSHVVLPEKEPYRYFYFLLHVISLRFLKRLFPALAK